MTTHPKLARRILANYQAAIMRSLNAETDEETEAAFAEAIRYERLLGQVPAIGGDDCPIETLKRDLGLAS